VEAAVATGGGAVASASELRETSPKAATDFATTVGGPTVEAGSKVAPAVTKVVETGRKVTGGKAGSTAAAIGKEVVSTAAVAGQELHSRRKDIGETAAKVGETGAVVGRRTALRFHWTCCASFRIALGVVRPHCSQCGRALTGGCCSKWPAFTHPGCQHVICRKCHERAITQPQLRCIRCAKNERAKNRGCLRGCFFWLKVPEKPKVADPDYHQGYVSTKQLVEDYFPALAWKIAMKHGLETQKVLDLLTSADSKSQLSMLSKQTSIPIELK